jgi:hypothetical protein
MDGSAWAGDRLSLSDWLVVDIVEGNLDQGGGDVEISELVWCRKVGWRLK